jgi:spermidine synthase
LTADPRFLLVLLCFLFSGATALVYQTAWTREFAFVFGTSDLAVATVLAAYMGGLTVGAALAARFTSRVRRPVLVYGALELGIGVSAFLVPAALRLATPLYVALFGGSDAFEIGGLTTALFYVACSFVILMLPTAFMGATLPLLARHAVHSESQLGSRVGALYATNTAGAVIGTLLAGFVLLPRLGLHATVLLAVAGNGLVFVLAVLASRGAPEVAAAAEGAAPLPRPSFAEGGWVLPAILLSGVASFTYEVLWTRLLGNLLGGSVYAFATMLASFLVGIALGSAFAARRATTPRRAAAGFAVAELGVAILAAVAFAALNQLPDLARWLSASTSRVFADAVVAGLILLPSTLCIGATFPFAVRVLARRESDAGPVSARVFAWNTVGAILGALGGGFFLIPALGYEGALSAAALLNAALALGAALLLRPAARRLAAAAAVALALLLVLRPEPPWRLLTTGPLGLATRGGKVAFYAVGRSATVLLLEERDMWHLTTNGLPESSILRTGSAATRLETARWLSALPVIARPDARTMLVVGLGGGVVVERIPEPIQSIDVVELEPEVVNANRAVAALRMNDPLSDPRVRVHENDARGALQLADRRFDVIVSQPSHPWTAGASHLYTREFFELVESRLEPDGVFSQWMGSQFVDAELLRILLATLLDVFPHARLYASDVGSVVFLASNQPLAIEQTVARALAASPGPFAFAGMRTPEDVAAGLILDEEGARRFAAGAEISTDDRNHLRTRSPELVRNFSSRRVGRGGLAIEKTFSELGLIPEPAPGLDRVRLVRALARRPFLQIASSVARGIREPAQRSAALARIASAKGEPGAVLGEARKAIEADPASRDALAELIDLWRYGVQPGRDLARSARPAADGKLLVRGMDLLEAKDFAGLRALEPGLAKLEAPGDPLLPTAVRLRAAWRTYSGDAELAREATALLDRLQGGTLDRFDYLERARASLAAGDSFGALSSLQQLLAGTPRRRMPPRLLFDARALLRTVAVAPEWEPWKQQLRNQLERPAAREAGDLAVSR